MSKKTGGVARGYVDGVFVKSDEVTAEGAKLQPKEVFRGALKAAVIGLGQAGSRFDEEPRGAVWSHVGAYLALPDVFSLVAGVDVEAGNRQKFLQRCPRTDCFDTVLALLAKHKPDVISIATPAPVRAAVVDEILARHRPRLIICEKPLAVSNEDRGRIVSRCREAGVACIVNYNRRYSPIYQFLKKQMEDGLVGPVRSVTIRIANRVISVGSHALDLLCFLMGSAPVVHQALPVPALFEGEEPAVDFLGQFDGGRTGRLLNDGFKKMLLFEVDVFGDAGRLVVKNNGDYLEHSAFEPSRQYQGYHSEQPAKIIFKTATEDTGTFLRLITEAGEMIRHGILPTCSAAMALESEALLDILMKRGKT